MAFNGAARVLRCRGLLSDTSRPCHAGPGNDCDGRAEDRPCPLKAVFRVRIATKKPAAVVGTLGFCVNGPDCESLGFT